MIRGLSGVALMLLALLSNGALANVRAQTFALLESPQPYEPFTVAFSVDNVFELVEYVSVDVVDNEIIINLQVAEIGFIPPQSPVSEVEIQGLPPGAYSFVVRALGYLGNARYEQTTTPLAAVIIPEIRRPNPVYSFFNTRTQRYYSTFDYAEAEQLHDSRDWNTVDRGFFAWYPNDTGNPESAQPVCKFYSLTVDSHFYTADPDECSALRALPDAWTYEGIAFEALVPTGGICPTGTDPVWRLFNNRDAEQQTNHRYVASQETARTMMAAGWIGEGVVFCSPSNSDPFIFY